MKNISAGIANELYLLIAQKDTAEFYGSGLVPVFATPAMVALMEKTSLQSVEPFLDETETTVGYEVNVRHYKAIKIGQEVKSISLLKNVEGRKLIFRVEVWSGNDKVGEGTHTRFIVDKTTFLNK